MIVIKFNDQCDLPESKPSCCNQCPFFVCEDDRDQWGEWTGEYVYHCYFGGPHYTEDFDEVMSDEDGNEVDEVVNNNCPIISITKEEKPE